MRLEGMRRGLVGCGPGLNLHSLDLARIALKLVGMARKRNQAGTIWFSAFAVVVVACGGAMQADDGASASSGDASAGGTSTTPSNGVVSTIGGTAAYPVTPGAGGAGGAAATFDGGGFGGLPFTGYCAGNSPKLRILGQDLSPAVADYKGTFPSLVGYTPYGRVYQTSATLGFDLQVVIQDPGRGLSDGICYTNNLDCPQVYVRRTDEVMTSLWPTVGTTRMDPDPSGAHPFQLGLCVEVDDKSSSLVGTKIFLPSPGATSYWN
jgi:hypothetical protein